MQRDTPVLILPGIGNSGPQHWQTLWELRHSQWRRVNLGEWDGPVCEDWVRALDVAVQACSSPPVLVAHQPRLSPGGSLGSSFSGSSEVRISRGGARFAECKLPCHGAWICAGADDTVRFSESRGRQRE